MLPTIARRVLTVVTALGIARCATQAGFDCPNLAQLARRAVPRIFYHPSGRVSAMGRALPGEWNGSLSTFPAVRVGL
jgi:hypothetical protein